MEGRCEGGVREVWGRYGGMQRGVPMAVERLESVVLSCTDTPKSARLGLGLGLGSGLGLGFTPLAVALAAALAEPYSLRA